MAWSILLFPTALKMARFGGLCEFFGLTVTGLSDAWFLLDLQRDCLDMHKRSVLKACDRVAGLSDGMITETGGVSVLVVAWRVALWGSEAFMV